MHSDSQFIATAVVVVAGVLGLLIGSFLNVVIYRVPIGKSIVTPPSACPNCGHVIAWYDNIPVISWLVLRGKCRNCANPISARYPLVELGTGVLFALVAWRLSGGIAHAGTTLIAEASVLLILAYLYFAAISVALAAIDLDSAKLPNVIVLPAYGVGLVLFTLVAALSGEWDNLLQAVIGAAALFVLYFVTLLIYPAGMGMGDVKLAGVIGLFLGWAGWGPLAVGAFAAFVLGGLFGVALLLVRRANRKSGIPFGPWMLAGAFIGLFFGGPISAAYLGFVGLA